MIDRRRVAAFLAVSFFYWMSQYLFVPTLPEFVRERTGSLVAVGIILSMYGLWQAVIRMPLGIAVDKTGRGKGFLVVGFLVGAAGALVLAFGKGTAALTVGRSMNGIAAGTWVPLIVVFSALFPPREAVVATSLLTFSGSFGRMIATSLTGWLNGIGGYSLAFYLGAAAAVVCIVIIAAMKIERVDTHVVSAHSIAAVFRRADVLLPSIISAVMQFGNWAVTFSFMPILAAQIGADQVTQSLLVSASIVSMTIGNLLNAPAVRRVPRTVVLYVTIFLFAVGIGVFVIAHTIVLFFAATLLMGFGNGFAYPTLMGLSIERVDLPHRTTAMGIHQSVYSIGMFAGPWIGGILAHLLGIRPTFAITAIFCLAAAYPLVHVHRRLSASHSG